MIEYFINKESRVVVAKFDDEQTDLIQASKAFKSNVFDISLSYFIKNIMMNPSMGKAVCSKEDVFDEEVGQKIARSKLLLQYNKKLEKLYDYILNRLEIKQQKIYKKQLHAIKKQVSINQFLCESHK